MRFRNLAKRGIALASVQWGPQRRLCGRVRRPLRGGMKRGPESPQPVTRVVSQWSCVVCTLDNDASAVACDACGAANEPAHKTLAVAAPAANRWQLQPSGAYVHTRHEPVESGSTVALLDLNVWYIRCAIAACCCSACCCVCLADCMQKGLSRGGSISGCASRLRGSNGSSPTLSACRK